MQVTSALTPPDPTSGWSRETLTVSGAIVCPPTESKLVQACGIRDAEGRYVPQGSTWRGQRAIMVEPANRPKPVAKLPGRHLWLGQFWSHFGHFMCESLARIWAYDHENPPDSLVMIPKRPGKGEQMKGYQHDLLALMDIGVPVTILDEPTEVEQLIVPGQGFGLGPIDRGTPEFRAFFARHFARGVAPRGSERIYLSRSALGGLEGGALLEDRLEELFAAEGYEILHPQKLPITEQVARYKAATHVAGLDGSAFHLFGFTARPDQRAAVIQRRNSSVYLGLVHQIEAFSGRSPAVISALVADWIPDKHKRPGRYSFGQLDFAEMGAQLARAGFLTGDGNWQPRPWREVKAAVQSLGAAKDLTFIRRKVAEAGAPRQETMPEGAEA